MEILQHGPVVAATSCSVVDLHSSELMSEIGEVCLLPRKQFFSYDDHVLLHFCGSGYIFHLRKKTILLYHCTLTLNHDKSRIISLPNLHPCNLRRKSPSPS